MEIIQENLIKGNTIEMIEETFYQEKQSKNILEWLRALQIDWQLNIDQLAKISHGNPEILKNYLALPTSAHSELSAIPAGLENAVALISIYQNLVRMFPNLEKQNEWLMTPNSVFENNKPWDVMAMSPDHLGWVSYTLESERRFK